MSNFIDSVLQRQPYVIAEAGINHNGDMALAKDMIFAAKESGAHCIKFQSFISEKYISSKAGRAGYQNQASVGNKSQKDIIQECELNRDQIEQLQAICQSQDIDFMSTPFEVWSLEMLISVKVPAIKISSCNLTNYPFLQQAANSGVPILLSTGMGDMVDVIKAMEIFKRSESPLILFQCTSNYPSRIENANLRVIPMYQELFDVPVGLSDHTPTHTTSIAAVALGASAIEKHFTLSRKLPGIDQQASLEPSELKELVTVVSDCHKALGSSLKFRTDEEADTKAALRRSLVASRDLTEGEVLTNDMVEIKRPGTGLSTDMLSLVIDRKLCKGIKKDELLLLDAFEK